MQRAQHPGGHHHLLCSQRLQPLPALQRIAQRDFVATAGQRPDEGGLPLGQDGRAKLLGQVEVVFVQAVFGPVGAAGEAAAAAGAAAAGRAAASKIGIGRFLPRPVAEVDAQRNGVKGMARAQVAGRLPQIIIHQAVVGVGGAAQHLARGGVMGAQFRGPIDR